MSTMKKIVVYVCPTTVCGNYFASSSSPGLEDKPNLESSMRHNEKSKPASAPEVTSHRIDCPDCRAAGRGVVRRMRVEVSLPIGTPDAPELTSFSFG